MSQPSITVYKITFNLEKYSAPGPTFLEEEVTFLLFAERQRQRENAH